MKKKFLVFFLLIILLVSGCGKESKDNVIDNLKNKISNLNSYYLTGNLELINNSDSYTYDVEVLYKKDNNFKVKLINKINNHEQIILRNKEGVYVLTPSLNKSFKFQSEWPYNNSQSYLLQTIIKDIENDSNKIVTEDNDMYIIKTAVNYSNNKELINQNIYVDKDLNIKEINVMDENGNIQIKMTFNTIDYNKKIDDKEFIVENVVKENEIPNQETSSKIDTITYPLYIPSNTYLSDQETITTENGQRIILTFTGESPFMLIQETAVPMDEFTTIPTYGEPCMFLDTIGTISEQSVSWMSNGIEYYVTSDNLSEQELLNVAKSIGALPVADIK